MAGSAPNAYFQIGTAGPPNPKEGDTWDNGAQIRIWTRHRGWVNVAGPAVETNA